MTVVNYYTEVTDVNGVKSYTANTNLPTVQEIRTRWCFGLPLYADDGTEMKDEDIMSFVMSAIKIVERKLGVFLKPMVLVNNAEDRGLVKGTDFDKEEAPYDYDRMSYANYGFLQLRERPVQSIESFSMVLPNGNKIIDFYRDANTKKWVKLYKDSGQVHIVPYAGDPTLFAMLGGSQTGFPFVTGSMNSNLPQMFNVDYTAGYGLYEVPDDVRNVVAKIASIDLLGISGDAVLAGISSQSISMDGLSESLSTSSSATSGTYTSHTLQMQKEVDNFFSPKGGGARTSERGFTMTGL